MTRKQSNFLSYEVKMRIRDTTQRVAAAHEGQLPNDVVASLAGFYNVSASSIRRVHANAPKPPHPKAKLETRQLVVVAERQGNRTKAHEQCVADGLFTGSYTTFRRRLKEVDPVVAAGVTKGGKAAIDAALYGKQNVKHRLERVYYDHEEAPVEVAYCGGLHKPWNSWLIDAASGYVLGLAITLGDGVGGVPHTEAVVALLASCAVGHYDEDGNLYGGIPGVVWCDNALQHMAEAMTNGCIGIGSAARLIPKGSPWYDGKVERWNIIFEEGFCSTLPRYSHGLKTRYGKEPLRADDVDPIHFREYVVRALNFVEEEMDKPGKDGKSRRQRWLEDPTPIEVLPRDEVRHLFLGNPEPRKVTKNGIKFDNIDFIDPGMELRHWRGRSVRIRHLVNDRSFIDVYDPQGNFICTAVPAEHLDEVARGKLRRVRNNSFRRVDVILKEGAKKALAKSIEEGERIAIADGGEFLPPTPTQEAEADEEAAFHKLIVEKARKKKEEEKP